MAETATKEAWVEGTLPFRPHTNYRQLLLRRRYALGGNRATLVWAPERSDGLLTGLKEALLAPALRTGEVSREQAITTVALYLPPTSGDRKRPMQPRLVPDPDKLLKQKGLKSFWNALGFAANPRGQLWPKRTLDEIRLRVMKRWGTSLVGQQPDDVIAFKLTGKVEHRLPLNDQARIDHADAQRQLVLHVFDQVRQWLVKQPDALPAITNGTRWVRTEVRRLIERLAKKESTENWRDFVSTVRAVAATQLGAMAKYYIRDVRDRMNEALLFGNEGEARLFRLLFGRYRQYDNGYVLGPIEHEPILAALFHRFLSERAQRGWITHILDVGFDPPDDVAREWLGWLNFYVEVVLAQRVPEDAISHVTKSVATLPGLDALKTLADPESFKPGALGDFENQIADPLNLNAVFDQILNPREKHFLLCYADPKAVSFASAARIAGVDSSHFRKTVLSADAKLLKYARTLLPASRGD